MTISISYTDGANQTELEIIRARAGIEQDRCRVKSDTHGGVPFSTYLDGSETLILREVAAAADLEPKPGEQRHGTLDVPILGSSLMAEAARLDKEALQPGDFDLTLEQLDDQETEAADRVYVVLAQFLATEGQPIQQELYHELSQAQRAHADAVAALTAYLSQVAA
ncbi:MAG TPA: hypothetical protein VJ437_13120 [Acidiferrobacterales bacterium]|nr:hypothetical protein [Acidiferrobacterales bacterium]